jgi:NAD(P)H-dependent flavin oxidoreductase YrpB (nitropropane dioxygenase family)
MSPIHRLICLTLPGYPDPSIAIAASRAGALGVLDLEYVRDVDAARAALARLARWARGACGVKIDLANEDFAALLQELPPEIETILIARPSVAELSEQIQALQLSRRRVLVEATDAQTAAAAASAGAAGIILKGHEAGGRVGEETAFVLFQRCMARLTVPVWVHGGIGAHTAPACIAAGAAGVVMDWQLALTRESPLPASVRDRLAKVDGSETILIGGGPLGDRLRVYARPGLPALEAILAEGQRLAASKPPDALPGAPPSEARWSWRDTVARHVGSACVDPLLLLSQDAAFAADLARQHRTVAGIVRAIEQAIPDHVRTAQDACPLDAQGPLAVSHGTRYPILQGPMTRVSDVASFCEAVAAGGALPFLALALMRAPQVEALLRETKERIGERPWGVGILGFAPAELRQEQLEVVRRFRPPFAIIAGGRPDQAAQLEQVGIASYLHVPSPGLLELFLRSDARRFIFEGRECGGHVGPRSSFVLWQSMIDLLIARIDAGSVKGVDCHVIFAGGIHDARSAAMVAVMASPLTARGVKIGVLMGTAYLFTEEAVASGAITDGFQREALQSDHTVLLETGPGHAIRCLETPFIDTFQRETERLLASQRPHEEARAALEALNLGRLRIASKGIKRHPDPGSNTRAPRYVPVSAEEQRAEGVFMSGQIASLRSSVTTIDDLHREVAVGGTAFLKSIDPGRREEAASPRPCDVAIIGMSTLLPKASTLQRYWENILGKVDAIEEVPKDRWDTSDYFDADRQKRDRIYSRWGGFLDAIPFDPAAYGMPPNSVASIEPVQLLALEAARAALADAGYKDRPFDRERASVILGAGGGIGDLGQLYGFRSMLPMFFGADAEAIIDQLGPVLPEWSEDSFPGILANVIAGRIANRLDLGGANFTVDAACASSLAAVHLAARELESGASDLVLVGGVDALQGPFSYMAFSKTQALSPRGR